MHTCTVRTVPPSTPRSAPRPAFAACLSIALVAACAREPAGPSVRHGEVELSTGPTVRFCEQGPPTGEAVVLLHGFTDSAASFELLLPYLPPDARVLAFDQRGHGASSKDLPSHRFADLAADVVAFLDAMQLPKATIVGHSMGSMVAQHVAIAHGDRVDRLVLIGSAARVDNPPMRELLAVTRVLTDPVDPEFVREFQMSTLATSVPADFLADVVAASLSVPARIWRQVHDDFVLQDTTAALPRIAAPTLVLWGERDALFERSEQDRLARGIPRATLRTFAGLGHAPHWERPDLVAAELRAFFAATEPAR